MLTRALPALLLLAALAAAQAPPRALAAWREFQRIGAQPLWPGFDPRNGPVAVFDGANTYLFGHPAPPEGFRAVEGVAGAFIFPGRHESVRANTGTQLNGVATATADISRSRASPDELAALFVHETFHVFQAQRYPKFGGNEMDLFTYPLDNAGLLLERRLETLALRRALTARRDSGARCWAEVALGLRAARFARLPAASAAYERGSEWKEGVAQYVEYRSIGKAPQLSDDDFPAAEVRQRAYATGQAWALLLDRFAPGWTAAVPAEPSPGLDDLLRRAVPPSGRPRCGFGVTETGRAAARARAEVKELQAEREQKKRAFASARGWRVDIVAGKEPLWPHGFDPWNITRLGGPELLHTRWLKLGNSAGALEVLGHAALTTGAGEHPILNGVRSVAVTGLPEPQVSEDAGKVTITAGPLQATLTATVERGEQVLTLRLP